MDPRRKRAPDVLPDSLPKANEPDVLPDSLGQREPPDRMTPDSLPPRDRTVRARRGLDGFRA